MRACGRGGVYALSFAVSAAGLFGGMAWGARLPSIDVDRLILDSGVIAEVRVTAVDPSVGQAWPATRVAYVIEESLADGMPSAGAFTVPEGIEPGGAVDGDAAYSGAVYSGYEETPGFTPGETYLLFLRRAPWRISPVTHWRDGFLRAVEVADRRVYVDAGGACVIALHDRVVFGPRITEPPWVPGRGAGWSSHGPRASAAGDCLSTGEVRFRLEVRMRQLGWRPGPAPTAPSGPVGVHATAESP